MAAPSHALQNEIAALQSALAFNKLAAARARKAQKQLRSGGLGPVGRKVVLCIYIESKYDVDLALRAACRWSSSKHPTDVGYPTRAMVQDLFLAASDMDLQNASEPSGTAWAQAARHAKAFLAEAATFFWVKSCNQAGVAPQSMAVFSTWEQKHFGGPLPGAPPRRYMNKWVQRFRSRWGLRRRILRPEVHQDPASVQAKARESLNGMVPFLGPENGPKNGSGTIGLISPESVKRGPLLGPQRPLFSLQVSVFWKLAAYYVNTKYADRQIIFLNMDETSIPYTMTHLPGCVAVQGSSLPRMAVRKQDRRGALTYVSVVCDMPHIQAKLPHYLFGSETKLTKKLLKGQHALPQTCLRVIRQKSAWTSSKNISMIVKDLAGVLKSWPDLQAILLLDVASPHLAKEVMETARLNQVQLLYIPAGLTDKLQPLDLTAFHSFKTHLKRRYQALRAGSFEAGLVDPLAWLFELMECPREFFAAKRWKRTFESVGASMPPDAKHLHRELHKLMGCPTTMPEGLKPSLEELLSIFPARRRLPHAHALL